MNRILVLTSAGSFQDVADCLESARRHVSDPGRLSFGILLQTDPTDAECSAMHQLESIRSRVANASLLSSFSSLWRGEDTVLTVHPSLRFHPGWDTMLRRTAARLEKTVTGKPFLTGLPPAAGGNVYAFRPLGVDRFTSDSELFFRPGTPVRCTDEPQRTAFLWEGFCCAPAGLFLQFEKNMENPSAVAYAAGWTAYVPACVPVSASAPLPLFSISPSVSDGESWKHFAARLGLAAGSDALSGMLRTGILSPDLNWDLKIPVHRRLVHRLQSLSSGNSRLSLLCVSAFLSVSLHPENSREENAVYLRRLASVRNLPLFLFADRTTMPSVQVRHPNVMEYLDSYGLPMFRPPEADEHLQVLRLSSLFILLKSYERNPGHSHYAWVDPSAVNYPVDPTLIPDLKPWCTDRITLACINGKPDPSVIIVPSRLLEPLCEEVAMLCEPACKKYLPLPAPEDVLSQLIEAHPDRFALSEADEAGSLIAAILQVGASVY